MENAVSALRKIREICHGLQLRYTMIPLITVSVRALIKTCSDKFLKIDKKAPPIELLFLLKLQTYACDFSIKGSSLTILRSIYGRLPL